MENKIAYFHLPGLFEFNNFYKTFLPLYRTHSDWFYPWCRIESIYGAPFDCIWGGGRIECGESNALEVCKLLQEYGISARLTFSNSLLKKEHLNDNKCNQICKVFRSNGKVKNGIIIHSDLLLSYLKEKYPEFYFVSSTTKVLTDFEDFKKELDRPEFEFVVPDFRLNHDNRLLGLTQSEKEKVEFLVNENCFIGCKDRKECYENVSRKNLGELCPDHICRAPKAKVGYRFSDAMENPSFIGTEDIINRFLPNGFSNYKIEGRGLGSAILLEFILYYLTKKEYWLRVREELYLDSNLDLF